MSTEPGTTSVLPLVLADLQAGGTLARQLPTYEPRPAQLAMARVVTEAIESHAHAVIEAQTGTGKSYGYLLPLIRSGTTAVVSTANKALQDQLFSKDIPFLQRHIAFFEAALVKGVSNYVCLDRFGEEDLHLQFYVKDPQFQRLAAFLDEQGEQCDGDFDALPFALGGALKGRICGDNDHCTWHKCPSYQPCYIRQMRERARHAQIIVVNHTLLLLNVLSGGAILPKHEVVVVDEAHHLEAEATKAFTTTVSYPQVMTLLSLKLFRAHSSQALLQEASDLADQTWEALLSVFDQRETSKARLSAPIEAGLKLASTLEKAASWLVMKAPAFPTEKEELLYHKLIARIRHLAENIRVVFQRANPNQFVYYLEQTSPDRNDRTTIEASAAPFDVAELLERLLFRQWPTICTSATLATVGTAADGKATLEYFRRRVGLSSPDAPVLEAILPPAFDYSRQALLYVPRPPQMPEPAYGTGREAQAYILQVALQMDELVRASQGRAFLLFSSKRMLDAVYEQLAPHLQGFCLLRQGDLPRAELVRQFKAPGEQAILFGLKSFWEGVDIAGEALSLVVIDKLPFDPPDDPVHEARVARMKAAGENWFGSYVLPQAVLRLKQGMGRLIRTKQDTGVMVLLDSRMYSKSYGSRIFKALPNARRTNEIKEVEQFFCQHAQRGDSRGDAL